MFLDALIRHRRALHRIPELMYDLPETQKYVLGALAGLNCEISTVAGSGVLAYFDAGKPETVLFRSDMDALPVQENTLHNYPSAHPGRMHACGHDGHMATLIAFAEWVNDHVETLPRNVLLAFQPAEESGGGGEKVAESGCIEKYGVTRAFAIHVEPNLPAGVVASRPGPLMARASEIHLDVEGRAGHAAIPGAGNDALAAAVDFVHGAYRAEEALPGEKPHRMKFCQLQAGNSTNVIADAAHVKGTLRTFADADFDFMKAKMAALAAGAEEKYGVRCRLNILDGYPAVINDERLFYETAARTKIEPIPEASFLGEDFSYYGRRVPAVLFRVGLGTNIPLHAANFDFDERALLTGVELFITLAEMDA
jgi:hippurate hydrolase